jgi:16S rRNA (cytosine967-C5)-methyltransferase
LETIIKPFQLGIAARLLELYTGEIPFSNFFNEQCKLHRNWGSRDRKIYRQACYAYLRIGFALQEGSTESNIQFALQPVESILDQIEPGSIYPHKAFVSNQVNFTDWNKSLLYQKPVYLAIIKGQEQNVAQFIREKQIGAEFINERILKVRPNTNCEEIIDKGWGWIMDISSQKAAESIRISENDKVWDCCSGAGGKSLFIRNVNRFPFSHTCSDARYSILENMKERFKKCNFPMPAIELCDLQEPFHLKERYNILIADVPCSGSGTWGRTPENITRTNLEKILFYAKLQKTIVDNARKNLIAGGRLYYITCSVFKEENELNTQYFEDKSGFRLISQRYNNEAVNESDWLFCAELEKI